MQQRSKMLEIKAWGHENISATHYNTLEVTKDEELTTRGTCIIGVRASLSTREIPDWVKEKLRQAGSMIHFEIIVDNQKVSGVFEGHPELILSHPKDIVIRKSSFICPRTLGIKSTLAARDIPDEIKNKLANPQQEILLRLYFNN